MPLKTHLGKNINCSFNLLNPYLIIQLFQDIPTFQLRIVLQYYEAV